MQNFLYLVVHYCRKSVIFACTRESVGDDNKSVCKCGKIPPLENSFDEKQKYVLSLTMRGLPKR